MSNSKTLNKMVTITSIGDYLSLFAVMALIVKAGYGVDNAALGWVVKYLGMGLGAFITPLIVQRFKTKIIFVLTQLLSAIFCGLIIINANSAVMNLWGLLSCLLLINTIKTVFDTAKDSFSKIIAEEENISHLTTQSKLVGAFFNAQMIGAISSGLMLCLFPIWVSLLLDLLSFITTAIIATTLSKDPRLSLVKARFEFFYYLISSSTLLDVFFLRAIGFWIGAGIFNYYNSYFLMSKFDLPSASNSMLVFIQGAGGAFGSLISNPLKERGHDEKRIAFIGHIILSAGVIIFTFSPNVYIAFISIFIASLGVGGNMSASQALRAKVVNTRFFAEFVVFEMIVGRLTGGFVGTLSKYFGTTGTRPVVFMLTGATVILFTGFLHLKIRGQASIPIVKGGT